MSTLPETDELFAPSNGLRLCWQGFGEPKAPPLLLIMGLGAQMIWWEDDFCRALAGRGYYVVRFDNRDIGRSSYIEVPPPDLAGFFSGKPPAAPYTLDDMARDSVGLMDALKIERAHIVGASMGGMIAQLVAIHFPGRTATLTSIMSTTGERGLPPPRPEVWAALTAPPPLTVEAFIEANVRMAELLRGFPDDGEAADARARATRAAHRGLNPAGGARQTAAIFASGSRKEALAGVKTPTLVIHGVDDPLVPVEAGRATARAIPGARLLEFDRMGHTLPRALWPALIDALASHAR